MSTDHTQMDMEPTAPTAAHMTLLYHPLDKAIAEAYGAMLKRLVPEIVIEFITKPGTFEHRFIFILITDNYLDDRKSLKIASDLFCKLKNNVVPVLPTRFEYRKLPIYIKAVHPDKLYFIIKGSNPIDEMNSILPNQNSAVYYYTRSLTNLLKLDPVAP